LIPLDDWVGQEFLCQPLEIGVRQLASYKIEIAHLDAVHLAESQLSDLSKQAGYPSVGYIGLPIDFDTIFHVLTSLLVDLRGVRPA
jgi:hypothetical protein